MRELTLEDVRSAAATVAQVVRPTPLIRGYHLSDVTGSEVYLKPENLQRTGSFKIRGAYNKIQSLSSDERQRGVIASSAGNHAQGVALAATRAGIRSTIVMPETAPLTKILRTRYYGAQVVLDGEDFEGAYRRAVAIQEAEGQAFIHAFDDPLVIAGQGTIALEILDELADVDTLVVPIGGGGLISGIALAAKALNPKVRVVGVEAAGAPSALKALEVGKLVSLERTQTIADGIRVAKIGEHAFAYISRLVDEVVLVDDEEISLAMVEMMETSKLVVEGAGAVSVAALLNGRVANPGRKVCALLSGGNVDINLIARVVERGLADAGRHSLLRVRIIDQPGQLIRVLEVLASRRVNILDVEHHRAAWRVPVGSVDVEMLVETRNAAHAREITQLLAADGFDAKLLSGAG